jgi:hypothetical protein
MQENHNGILPLKLKLIIAPNPKLKTTRKKKLDFDPLTWSKYISEEKLLESTKQVYGCDPRDTEKYRALENAAPNESLIERLENCSVS